MRGKRIAVLEARLGQQLVDLVAKYGGVPFHAPALAEVADVDQAYIARLMEELPARPPRIAIFQTGVGTQALFNATDALGVTGQLLALLASTTVIVRGPKPTGALRARGVRIDRDAAEPYTTAEVLAALRAYDVHGARVLVQRYGVTNVELEEALRARGAEVVEIPTYRWSLPEDTRPLVELMDKLERCEIDAVVFTNAAQAYNLFALAQRLARVDSLRAGLNRTVIASIGPVSSSALNEHGVRVALEARPPKLGPLINALNQALGH